MDKTNERDAETEDGADMVSEDRPEPSIEVLTLVATPGIEAQNKAINLYKKESGLGRRVAIRTIKELRKRGLDAAQQAAVDAKRQEDRRIAAENAPLVVVRRKSGTRGQVMRWYAKDIEEMADQGYSETSHQMEGTARGCAALFVPKTATMVVTYRRER